MRRWIATAIRLNKMVTRFREAGVTSYTLKTRDKASGIGQATWQKIQKDGNIDMRTLNAACKLLNCQPGDLLEYEPDDLDTTDIEPSSID